MIINTIKVKTAHLCRIINVKLIIFKQSMNTRHTPKNKIERKVKNVCNKAVSMRSQ
jgi:hypothetical protein